MSPSALELSVGAGNPVESAEVEPRPMRRDAARNLQRVLAAAREVLAEQGTDASMELIASRAGVGVGTVYRNFPTKDALIDELVRVIMTDLIAQGQVALDRADGRGLEELLQVVGRSLYEHRSYSHLLVGRAASKAGSEQFRQLLAVLLAQAKAHGRIGPDIVIGDIMVTVWAIRGVIETSANVAPRAWLRHLDLHLAALRSPTPLTARPAVSARQLAHISHG